MNTQHTPVRLRASTNGTFGQDTEAVYIFTNEPWGSLVASLKTSPMSPNAEADTRRLVACWNACYGVPTEVLEAQQAGGLPWNVADQIDARLQRDELLAALKDLLNYDNLGAYERANAQQQARAAVAKVKGEQA